MSKSAEGWKLKVGANIQIVCDIYSYMEIERVFDVCRKKLCNFSTDHESKQILRSLIQTLTFKDSYCVSLLAWCTRGSELIEISSRNWLTTLTLKIQLNCIHKTQNNEIFRSFDKLTQKSAGIWKFDEIFLIKSSSSSSKIIQYKSTTKLIFLFPDFLTPAFTTINNSDNSCQTCDVRLTLLSFSIFPHCSRNNIFPSTKNLITQLDGEAKNDE